MVENWKSLETSKLFFRWNEYVEEFYGLEPSDQNNILSMGMGSKYFENFFKIWKVLLPWQKILILAPSSIKCMLEIRDASTLLTKMVMEPLPLLSTPTLKIHSSQKVFYLFSSKSNYFQICVSWQSAGLWGMLTRILMEKFRFKSFWTIIWPNLARKGLSTVKCSRLKNQIEPILAKF